MKLSLKSLGEAMSSARKLVFVALALSIPATVHAQTFRYEAQFNRLMGEPKETVSALIKYPWRDNPRVSLTALNDFTHGDSIRIVSVNRPTSRYNHWSHWDSPDHTIWVDLLDFSSRNAAVDLLASAAQRHSGYRWEDQLLPFTCLQKLTHSDGDASGHR